jgi:hypothetical protein
MLAAPLLLIAKVIAENVERYQPIAEFLAGRRPPASSGTNRPPAD